MPFKEVPDSPFTSTLRPLSEEEITAQRAQIPSLCSEDDEEYNDGASAHSSPHRTSSSLTSARTYTRTQ